MFWFLLILLLILAFLVLIICTKLTVLVDYYHHNDNDDLKLEFRIWFGLIKYKRHIPLIKVDDNSPSVIVKSKKTDEPNLAADTKQITKENLETYLEKTRDLINKVYGLQIIIRKFLNEVSVKKFDWHSFIGTGDAAHTGTVAGVLWTIKGSALGILSHYVKLIAVPEISITPHFQAAVIQTKLSCIFQFRIGHAMLAGLKLIKFWRGGKASANFSNEKMKTV